LGRAPFSNPSNIDESIARVVLRGVKEFFGTPGEKADKANIYQINREVETAFEVCIIFLYS
jgi:hypothetical protein